MIVPTIWNRQVLQPLISIARQPGKIQGSKEVAGLIPNPQYLCRTLNVLLVTANVLLVTAWVLSRLSSFLHSLSSSTTKTLKSECDCLLDSLNATPL